MGPPLFLEVGGVGVNVNTNGATAIALAHPCSSGKVQHAHVSTPTGFQDKKVLSDPATGQ